MKKVIFSLLLLGLIWSSNAQGPAMQGKRGHAKSKEGRTRNMIDRLDSTLNFSSDQKAKISELVQKRTTAVNEVRKKYADANGKLNEESRKVFRIEVKPLHQQFQSDFKAILSPEQKVKLETLKKKKRDIKGNINGL